MKVVEQTLMLLTLRERPIGIWILSIGTGTIGLLIFISSNPPIDWFGLFCIIGANLMMFSSPVRTCRFDKGVNQVTFKQKGWLGTKMISCPINNITSVQVESLKLIGIQFYKLSLRLVQEEHFYLTPVPSTDSQLLENLASYIQEFLRM